MEIRNENGLLVTGDNQCLGYLMNFPGNGIYDATQGKTEISRADADRHNQLLSKAQIEGLDNQCQIGQGGMFYYSVQTGRLTTFIGDLVAQIQHVSGRTQPTLWFWRGNRQFKARIRKDMDCVFVKRVK